ncbi:MAG: hypothetical protein AABY01_01135, partial [Nanoarchaeota archaeon]
WMPLLDESNLKFCPDIGSWNNTRLGIDPSGDGSNLTAMVLRDAFRAKIAHLEQYSTTKSVVEAGLTLTTNYGIPANLVTVDNFGEGANVSREWALATQERINAVNVGDPADNRERFINMRAELYWRLREWILAGGQLVKHEKWKELLTIRYKRTLSGKIQIMSKLEMRERMGADSPDCSDAFSETFLGDNESLSGNPRQSQLSDSEIAQLTSVY